MPRKDYVAMAHALRQGLEARKQALGQDQYSIGQVRGYRDAVVMTANVFAADNPSFDMEWYLTACGLEN